MGEKDGHGDALDAHRECMAAVAALEATLGGDGGAWVDGLGERLEALVDTLREHFDEEERASLYREVPQRVPRFGPQLERLAAEHAAMLDDAAALTRRADTIDRSSGAALDELEAAARLLIARLRRHEAEENEILLTAHWREIGGSD